MGKWQNVINFFQKQVIGKKISRTKFLEAMDFPVAYQIFDTYKSVLVRNGYLATLKKESYVRIKNIPINLPLNKTIFYGNKQKDK